jgi:hypothetical protein
VNHGGLIGWVFEALGLTRARENLLKAFETKSGVLIFFAHGDREKLYLPDGTVITAEEVSRLRLPSRPLILLFSCEGGKPSAESETVASFPDAFKKAGARAILSFEEKVDAGEAASLAMTFLEHVRSGKTDLSAIQETVLEIQARKGPRVRLKAEAQWKGNSDSFVAFDGWSSRSVEALA